MRQNLNFFYFYCYYYFYYICYFKSIWWIKMKIRQNDFSKLNYEQFGVSELASNFDLKTTDLFHPHRALLIRRVDGTGWTPVWSGQSTSRRRASIIVSRKGQERDRQRERECGSECVEGRREWGGTDFLKKSERRGVSFCRWQDALAGDPRRPLADRPAVRGRDPDAAVLQPGRGQKDHRLGYVRRRHHRSGALL